MDLEAEIDRLYGLPLDEFVAQRAELTKQLRSDGEREAAERVKGLRKPTLGAWAINQATRRREAERDELLAAGERLREAHEALLSGGDAAALRDATRDERALVGTLADTAAAIATEGGKGGPALQERLRSTLHAAALDEEVRDELAAGRVLREREASGLGMLGDVALPARGSQRRGGGGEAAAKQEGAARKGQGKKGQGKKAPRGRAAAKSEPDAATERERAAEERDHAKAVAEAERELAEAQATFAEAESTRDDASARLDAAREELEQARAGVTTTRRATREQEREVARLERALKRLRSKAPGSRSG